MVAPAATLEAVAAARHPADVSGEGPEYANFRPENSAANSLVREKVDRLVDTGCAAP